MTAALKPGTEVTIRYTLCLEDGTVVDATEGEEVLTFTLGDGTLLPELESVVRDLQVGERHTYLLSPEHAFGFPDEDNVHTLPRSDFPAEMALEPGLIIAFDTPSGAETPGAILEVKADSVVVDFNHPLAGRNISFDIELVAVQGH